MTPEETWLMRNVRLASRDGQYCRPLSEQPEEIQAATWAVDELARLRKLAEELNQRHSEDRLALAKAEASMILHEAAYLASGSEMNSFRKIEANRDAQLAECRRDLAQANARIEGLEEHCVMMNEQMASAVANARERDALAAHVERLRYKLKAISEYWSGNSNEKALLDAVESMKYWATEAPESTPSASLANRDTIRKLEGAVEALGRVVKGESVWGLGEAYQRELDEARKA